MIIDESHQNQDNLSRRPLSDPEEVKRLLSSGVPSHVLDRMDLDTLQYEDPSKFSPHFKNSYFDTLVSVQMKDPDNKLYVAIEHQTKEKLNILGRRLFKKLLELQEYLLDRKLDCLPLVFGLVVSNKPPYKGFNLLKNLFGDEELAMTCLGLTRVIPLNEDSFDDIKKDGAAGLLTPLLREGQGGDFCKLVEEHTEWLREQLERCSEDELEEASAYMLGLDPHPDALRQKLGKLGAELQGRIINAARKREQMGKEQGKEKN